MSGNHHKLFALLFVASAAGLVTACAGSICDRGEAVFKSLEQKAQPCQTGDGGSGVTFNKAQCERDSAKCNSDDIAILNKQFDCLDKVQTCTKGNELPWAASVIACTQDSNKLSAACRGGSSDGGQ